MIYFSIIIPIYNAENSLSKCLDSILEQRFNQFEIILINDGSIDKSKEICELYREKDNRIKFIDKVNTGVSNSRNIGILNSKGKYIIFIDSDDYIEKDMFISIYNNIFLKEYDLVFWGYKRVNENGVLLKDIVPNYRTISKDELNKKVNLLIQENIFGYQCNKAFKRKIIEKNNILLDESLSLCEDLIFTMEYYKYINNYICLNISPYFYVSYDSSSLANKYRKDMFEIKEKIFKSLIDFCVLIDIEEKESKKICVNEAFECMCDVIENYINCNKLSIIIKYNEVKKILNSYISNFFYDNLMYIDNSKLFRGKKVRLNILRKNNSILIFSLFEIMYILKKIKVLCKDNRRSGEID